MFKPLNRDYTLCSYEKCNHFEIRSIDIYIFGQNSLAQFQFAHLLCTQCYLFRPEFRGGRPVITNFKITTNNDEYEYKPKFESHKGTGKNSARKLSTAEMTIDFPKGEFEELHCDVGSDFVIYTCRNKSKINQPLLHKHILFNQNASKWLFYGHSSIF